ncbi:MAG: beta-galactosidase trimerization domain-containing protein [Candidatus Omnitrophota bacterium]
MNNWLNKRSRIYWYDQYALNEQDTAFAKYDPDRIAEELVLTGADIVAIYATNQFGIAYYPSQIWSQHPNLKGQDYVGDLLLRLRQQGKKVVLYVNWLDSKHAEWNFIPIGHQDDPYCQEQPLTSWAQPEKANGRIQALPGGGWRFPCINSPHREQILAITREIVARYQPDAFHLDMFFNPGICACNYCRPMLEKICGTKEITKKLVEKHWVEFIDWRCEVSASFIEKVTAVLREFGVLAVHNAFSPFYMPAISGLDKEWLKSLDVYVSECFDAFLAPVSDLNSTSLNIRLQHALAKPSWMLRTSTPPHYGHWPISETQWQIYSAAAKTNGCKVFGPCGIGAYPDTTSANQLLKNIKSGFDFYMEDADLDQNSTSTARIALVFSWATRKYFEPGEQPVQWLEELSGWARMLIEAHLPFDILVAEEADKLNNLSRYDLIILPNAANLSDAFCESIRCYVRNGGRILASAKTSMRDEKDGRLMDFRLGDVLGVSFKETFEGPFAMEGQIEPEPACGILEKVTSTGKIIAHLVETDSAGSVAGTEDPLPINSTDWPIFTVHKFGKGKALYVSFDIGRLYSKHGDQHIGKRMEGLIDILLSKRQLEIKAPRTVEVTVWEQKVLKRTIIHLSNRSVPWTLPTDNRQITEVIPVHEIEIDLEKPYPKQTVSSRHARINVKDDGERLKITVFKICAYAAIIIKQTPS